MPGVYLIFQNRLFGDAISAVLASHGDIKLLGASDMPEVAATEIAELNPNVILLEEADGEPCVPDVQRILSNPTPCRLITLRLDHDSMHVWSGVWRATAGAGDLVEAIISANGEER